MKKQNKTGLIFLIFLMIIITIVSFVFLIYLQGPIESDNNLDAKKVLGLGKIVSVNDSLFLGSKSSSITITAYLDTSEKSSKDFIDNIYPQISDEFIKNGSVRMYFKSNILSEVKDYNNFLSIQLLECFKNYKRESYFDYYFDIFNNPYDEDFELLAKKHGLSDEQIVICNNKSTTSLKNDLDELDKFQLLGYNPVFLIGVEGRQNDIIIGVQNFERFKKYIRDIQISIGE